MPLLNIVDKSDKITHATHIGITIAFISYLLINKLLGKFIKYIPALGGFGMLFFIKIFMQNSNNIRTNRRTDKKTSIKSKILEIIKYMYCHNYIAFMGFWSSLGAVSSVFIDNTNIPVTIKKITGQLIIYNTYKTIIKPTSFFSNLLIDSLLFIFNDTFFSKQMDKQFDNIKSSASVSDRYLSMYIAFYTLLTTSYYWSVADKSKKNSVEYSVFFFEKIFSVFKIE